MRKTYNLMFCLIAAACVALPVGGIKEARANTAFSIKMDSCRSMMARNTNIRDWLDWEADIWLGPMLTASLYPERNFAVQDADEMDIGPTDAWEIITECRKLRGTQAQ